ncbi:AAA family ATPase [Nostoc sp. MS1]|uniref:AAA family ATPase n=1 Tax=Nostoc sp. MS1 TaxID=2764711 RepID=UPI001CC686C8|nr:AAA family ATPase [Nostoc sp. MS1]BCL38202.1 chromosome segregation protein SMC [Nostoc sp. MS1]
MEGKRFIHKIRLENFLSYGSEGEEIELQPLNVLIGPNASGKSNLIEAIGILREVPRDVEAAIRYGGGTLDFLWKGGKEIPVAEIQVTLNHPLNLQPLSYRLKFTALYGLNFQLLDEAIENEPLSLNREDVFFYYRLNHNGRTISRFRYQDGSGEYKFHEEAWDEQMLQFNKSILSQLKDIRKYPEITYLGSTLSTICLYRDLPFGRNSQPRRPQQADFPVYPLMEDGSNIGLVLNNLQLQIGNRKIIEKLKKFYELAEDISVRIYGGTVQIFIREEGLTQPIPATRLSDGTLRYLFLIALLLDPAPPPLICLEEPEIGLHPDILPTIAEMLIEASTRTQLIVTTHSDALVSALNEYPESILICERDEKGSHLRRLEPEKLKHWLENYTLGDLWRMGEIGGNRW